MKTFNCSCKTKHILFFESSHCIACKRTVGLDDWFDNVEPYDFDEVSGDYFKAAAPAVRYQKCRNHAEYGVCNGMVEVGTLDPHGDVEELCFACRFNETIPDLSVEEHIPLWRTMEAAKRRALYTLKALNLPLKTVKQDPEGGLELCVHSRP